MASKADRDYRVLHDALSVVRQLLKHGARWREHIPPSNGLVGLEISEARELLDKARTQIDDLFVLARVAEFERILRDRLKDAFGGNFATSDDTLRSIAGAIRADIDFWRLSDQVISMHATVNHNLKGQVKQVIEYRDWVAHGHKYGAEGRLPNTNVTPERAGQVLDLFLQQAGMD